MPVRVVTEGGSPVRIVTSGGDPVRIVTSGISDPVRVIGGGLAPDAPIFVSAEVGTINSSTVVVTFSTNISAPCGDCALGFTVLVNGNPDAITACVIVGGNTVRLTLTTAVAFGDVVTISYDSSVGCIMESTGVTDLATFAAQGVTNNVVTPWYRAGGAPIPIAAYQPKGAANYAASKINLANPGTYDAVDGVAFPTWAAATGWTFNGTTQYLNTNLHSTENWAALCRFSNASGNGIVFGADSAATNRFYIYPTFGGANHYYRFNGDSGAVAGSIASGVMGLTNGVGWLNGLNDKAFVTGVATSGGHIFIGATSDGINAATFLSVKIQALVLWNTSVGCATWIPAVSAAMAAL